MTTPHDHSFDLWDTFDTLRSEFGRRMGTRMGPRMGLRMGRGDVRSAILNVLTDWPMQGYQIIHEIEKSSNGAWKTSPGSVYPNLQLLLDEGLLQAKEASGRKTYSLTAAGTEQAAASDAAPWDALGHRETPRSMVLPKAGVRLAEAASQIARNGTAEQIESAVAIIDEARRKLYTILAQE